METGTKVLYESVADQLEIAILSDTTQIERKLPSEQRLAELYGVSRPVIREALKILKERGLVDSRQGAASVVTDYSVEQFQKSLYRITRMQSVSPYQVYAVRIALELASARYAAQDATAGDITALRALNKEMREKAGDLQACAQADTAFHLAIARCSGNPLLAFMTEALSSMLESVIEKTQTAESIENGYLLHEKMITAIESRDEEGAETLMRAHLTLSLRNFEIQNL